MNIQDIYRAHHVDRWQIVNVTRHQSLAEHSFNVAMIALRIHTVCLENGLLTKQTLHTSEISRGEIMEWALVHDLPEVYTGDVMGMFKVLIKQRGIDPFSVVEREIAPEYGKLKDSIIGYSKDVVKIADYLDGLKYLELYGNDKCKHTKKTKSGLRKRMVEFIEKQNRPEFGKNNWVVYQVEKELMVGQPMSIDKYLEQKGM